MPIETGNAANKHSANIEIVDWKNAENVTPPSADEAQIQHHQNSANDSVNAQNLANVTAAD